MKATCVTVETRTFTLTVEDLKNIVARELREQYGIPVVAANVQFDVAPAVDDDYSGLFEPA